MLRLGRTGGTHINHPPAPASANRPKAAVEGSCERAVRLHGLFGREICA